MHRLENHERNGRAFQVLQRFSGIQTSDMSRVHNGNNTYFITYNFVREAETTLLPSNRVLEGILPSSVDGPPMNGEGYRNRALRRDGSQSYLDNALASLRSYAACAQTQKTGKYKASIGAPLAVILNAFTRTEHGNVPLKEASDRIQNLCQQIERSGSIKINTPCSRQRVAQFSRAESQMLSVHVGSWQISLTTRTVRSGCVEGECEIQTCSALHVRRLRSGGGTYITAFFNETSGIEGYTSLPPVLCTYRQVRNTDRIFELVANDDLRSLEESLRAREAFLRDCDEDGRSLLFYASLHASIKICKFLVDRGADVDRFHYDYHRTSHQTTPLLAFRHTDQTTRESLDRAQICRKALLQAGADPTISHAGSDIRSAVLESIQGNVDCSGSNEFFDLLIREGSTFIDTRNLPSAWSPVILRDLH